MLGTYVYSRFMVFVTLNVFGFSGIGGYFVWDIASFEKAIKTKSMAISFG